MDHLKILNLTEENLRVAIFKKSYKVPSLKLIAWRIEDLPGRGGSNLVEIPKNYQVYISYSKKKGERENPNGGIKSPLNDIDVQSARFVVRNEPTEDHQTTVATLKRSFEDLVEGEIHIENRGSFGVWGHILLDGTDVFPPQVVTPGRTLMIDGASPFFAAIIDEFVKIGNTLLQGELRSTPMKFLVGDELIVGGSKWEGYQLQIQ